ncbi:MAG: serine/threonine protein kinase [Candidatus Melainabacteria bacterium]|nr:serine/threonine protein kinase [Candidatus Melainabacteria bacterium]
MSKNKRLESQSQSQLFTVQAGVVGFADVTPAAPFLDNACQQFAPGHVIDGKYQISEVLGEGGMGKVYRAHHLLLKKDVALKVLKSSVSSESWLRFQREAQLMGKLKHPSIVQLYDFGIANSTHPYYAMELLEGSTLDRLIDGEKELPLPVLLNIFIQICKALQMVHDAGVVHRDIKPSNFLLVKVGRPLPESPAPSSQTPSRDVFVIKLMDFGIAGVISDHSKQSLTQPGCIFGSPLYMSPEQALGERPTPQSDIYSLGCTLFHALTGEPPYVGENALITLGMHMQAPVPTLRERMPLAQYPNRLDGLLKRMLAKDLSDRIATMAEVKLELEMVLQALARSGTYKSTAGDVGSGAYFSILGQEDFRSRAGLRATLLSLPALLGLGVVTVIAMVCFFVLLPSFNRKLVIPESHTDRVQQENSADGALLDVSANGADLDRSVFKTKILNSQFSFPSESIGQIYIDGKQRQSTEREARGSFVFRHKLEDPLSFSPGPAVFNDPSLLRCLKGSNLTRMVVISSPSLPDAPWTDEHMKWVSLLPELTVLRLECRNLKLTHASAAHLTRLKDLKSLSLCPGLPAAADGMALSCADLIGLKSTRYLTHLRLAQQLGVHELFEFLAKGASDLKVLDIAGSSITDRDIVNMGKLKNLESLRLQSTTAINGSSLSSLASLHKLETLCLDLEVTDLSSLEFLMMPPRLWQLEVSKLKLPYDLKRRLLALPRTKPFQILER